LIFINSLRDLTLVKQWKTLNIQKHENIHYIVGMYKEGDILQVILPLSTASVLSMNKIKERYSTIPDPNEKEKTISGFTFGIVDSDSTLVYYKIHFDLISPKE